ncbi:MAG: PhnD/SsuA/transferrin family substrate-binding protein [Alphaproteobacteria bacterium]
MAGWIASLPQYDLPEIRRATDAWWSGIARHLRARGVEDVPDGLTRADDGERVWRQPDLLVTQTCGYPLMTELTGHLRAVATPLYMCDGCEGPTYASAIIVRDESGVQAVEDLRGGRAVINNWNSQSGMNALRHLVAGRANEDGRFFGDVVVSGGHALSMDAVRTARADVAAIDSVTWALHQAHKPDACAGLRILTWSASAPSLPYAVRVEASPDLDERVFAALDGAARDPDLADARADLLIDGFLRADNSDYRRMIDMRMEAESLGYPLLR